MLIITNGDAAVGALRTAGVRAAYLPWRDVLHEGPVPGGLTLEELSRVRARFIAQRGWGSLAEVTRDFERRDRRLANARHHHEIVLWFEHDLYDQLQLVQLLDWFASAPIQDATLEMICRHEYVAEVDPAVARLRLDQRDPVSRRVLTLGAEAWRAFTADDPNGWVHMADSTSDLLPFLGPAFRRLLEELPAVGTGLSRSETQILQALDGGATTPGTLFRACQREEQAAFMGDASFFSIVNDLAAGEHAAIAPNEGGAFAHPPPRPLTRDWLGQELILTDAGRAYLTGEADLAALHPIDRWLGGIHLSSPSVWRWNSASGAVVRPS